MVDQTLLFNPKCYDIDSLDDEIQVDQLCQELLKFFHNDLLTIKKRDPLTAGSLARGADYFLRDYMIDRHRSNIFNISAPRLKGFAGNWYIVQNLEPDLEELVAILRGIKAFYQFCTEKKLIPEDLYSELKHLCENHEFYQERMAAFFRIEGDGFVRWEEECPVV